MFQTFLSIRGSILLSQDCISQKQLRTVNEIDITIDNKPGTAQIDPLPKVQK